MTSHVYSPHPKITILVHPLVKPPHMISTSHHHHHHHPHHVSHHQIHYNPNLYQGSGSTTAAAQRQPTSVSSSSGVSTLRSGRSSGGSTGIGNNTNGSNTNATNSINRSKNSTTSLGPVMPRQSSITNNLMSPHYPQQQQQQQINMPFNLNLNSNFTVYFSNT